MRVPVVFFLLVPFVAGCDPMALRDVDVQLTAPTAKALASQSQIVLSANQADVQDALRIIDSVVTSDGLVRTPHQPQPELLALYDRDLVHCSVHLSGDYLCVDFLEDGRMSSTKEVKNMCKSLAQKLGSRFGTERVSVSH